MSKNTKDPNVKSEKRGLPHVFALLFIITTIMAILTWIIPAGEFERIESGARTVVVPNSYQAIESNPQGILDVFRGVVSGWEASSTMIFMVFIVGGALKILEETGSINAGLSKLITRLKGKESIAIIIVMTLMSIGGATGAFANPVVALMPIGIILAKGLGYDPVVGFGMIYLGAYAGFNTGFANVFTVGIAHEIAELPMFSGMGVRIGLHILYLALSAFFVLKYAKRIKEDPTRSISDDGVGMIDSEQVGNNVDEEFTLQHKLASLITFISIASIIYGSLKLGWGIGDYSVIFLIMGIASGIVCGLGPDRIAKAFVEGCSGMATAALVIGMARGISVVMTEGNIIDTLIHYISQPISSVGPVIGANMMYISNILINFFIPSGSGQAVTVMPIMVPIADLTGITRQVATQAFQFGDGFSNCIFPTAGTLMACLGLAKIPYEKYIKWLWKFFLIQFIIGIVSITLLQIVMWGPA